MYDFKKAEGEVLAFWKAKKIYEKSRKKNGKGKAFYMMDGPPYATGHIHMGTALNKILKDISMRMKRLQGYNVFDRAGYDTHGVPIEFQIEKQIGSKSKQDIEKYGVKKFINKCKEFATKYIDVMNSEFKNLGVWMDFKNPYLTLNNEYMEAIWDTFKIADKKGLLYLGKYPVHVCPRCETAVAYNEIEYAKQEDAGIFVKFQLKKEKKKYLLIFTTTPWTLPGNTGVMVNPKFEYAEVEIDKKKEIWIIVKDLVEKIMSKFGHRYKIKKTCKGKELEGLEYYNPLTEHLKLNLKNAYKVVLSSRYVNLEEGTGLVHTAPGHGKEDYEVGKEYKLDMPSPVEINGLLTEEAGKYAGKKARVVDEEIIRDLDEEKMLAYKEGYVHDYPLCWRCKEPLLLISLPQWFLKISSIQKKLLNENEKTNWIPSWMKLRMKAWLEGISDWPVSRKRYWGTPLPIWVCECGERKVIGSIRELEKLSGKKIKELHKPEIDKIELKCKCKGKMKRVEEILDVWFDSGVSSWAALNFPGEEKLFKKFWPADLNLEGKDQVRGWWNSQIILSEIKFNKKPFKNILVHGLVLDLGKRKMSKSLGNIVAPEDIINKSGRDFLRYYFARTSKGEDFAFDEKEFSDIQNAFRVLININNFINQLNKGKGKLQTEDKWIISKLNSTIKEAVENYNKYKYAEAIQILERFLINDLSRTYIQIIRERADETYEILKKIRIALLKLLAPVIPFITEHIWQELRKNKTAEEESVHLASWPKPGKTDGKLEQEMETALKIIEAGLAERDKAGIGLKWPLYMAEITIDNKIPKQLEKIIARQLNVKKIKIKSGKLRVKLDTAITPELEAEGFSREISRAVQAQRKKAGLVKNDKINLEIISDENSVGKLDKFEKFIKERTNSGKISIYCDTGKPKKDFAKVIIKNKEFNIRFSKI